MHRDALGKGGGQGIKVPGLHARIPGEGLEEKRKVGVPVRVEDLHLVEGPPLGKALAQCRAHLVHFTGGAQDPKRAVVKWERGICRGTEPCHAVKVCQRFFFRRQGGPEPLNGYGGEQVEHLHLGPAQVRIVRHEEEPAIGPGLFPRLKVPGQGCQEPAVVHVPTLVQPGLVPDQQIHQLLHLQVLPVHPLALSPPRPLAKVLRSNSRRTKLPKSTRKSFNQGRVRL